MDEVIEPRIARSADRHESSRVVRVGACGASGDSSIDEAVLLVAVGQAPDPGLTGVAKAKYSDFPSVANMMNVHLLRTLCLVAVAAAPACESARYYEARYDSPIEQELHSDAVAGSQLRALSTVLGIARPDSKTNRPKQVEMRLRLENLGTVAARLLPDDLSLVSTNLVPFGTARLQPAGDTTIPPGQAREFDMQFPAPEREVDWSALNLRFGVTFDEKRVIASAMFKRLVYAPYEPARWHVGVGYGWGW